MKGTCSRKMEDPSFDKEAADLLWQSDFYDPLSLLRPEGNLGEIVKMSPLASRRRRRGTIRENRGKENSCLRMFERSGLSVDHFLVNISTLTY